MAEPDLKAATIVTVGKDEPYPTGTPSGTVLANIIRAQDLTDGPSGVYNSPWERQRVQNLAAHGLIAGGAAGT